MNDVPTVLITGACGFCASYLLRALRAERAMQIVGSDVVADPPAALPLADYIAADLTQPEAAYALVRRVRPDWLFHLAGRCRGTPEEIYRVNLLSSLNLLEAVRESSPQARVLVVGSAAEYGPAPPESMPIGEDYVCRPRGAYGLSKHALCLAAQDYARNSGLKVVVARPFNIIGAGVPSFLVVGAILDRARKALAAADPPNIAVGNLDSVRDFVDAEDVAAAYLRMIRGDYWGEVFNLCSAVPRKIREVVELLLSHSPRRIKYHVDPGLLSPTDVAVFYGSCEKARRAFAFAPSKSLEESLNSAWEHAMIGAESCASSS
jgi:GDP-4-dehydro-6-deoxy-D-mannose reductase